MLTRDKVDEVLMGRGIDLSSQALGRYTGMLEAYHSQASSAVDWYTLIRFWLGEAGVAPETAHTLAEMRGCPELEKIFEIPLDITVRQ